MPISLNKNHVILWLYLALLALLLASLVLAGGSNYIHYLLLYLVSLLGTYIAFWKLADHVPMQLPAAGWLAGRWRGWVAALTLVAAASFAIAHLVHLGGVPVFQAMLQKDYYYVMLIRQAIFGTETQPLWMYGPNFLVKSVFPFLVFYFLFRSRLLLVLTLLVGAFYALALMNKLFIVLLVTPAVLFAFLARRWVVAGLMLVIPLIGLAFLVLVQNPHHQPQAFVDAMEPLRATSPRALAGERHAEQLPGNEQSAVAAGKHGEPLRPVAVEDHAQSGLFVAGEAIFRRVLLVPGEVMKSWFADIPARIRHGKGCGYRWLAPALHCDYVPYAFLIYELENPVFTAAGIRGSMTAASFVEDYANFGLPGLVLGGFMLGALAVAIGRIFRNDWQTSLALNAVPLILLMELPLSTVILTGGWVVTLMLYLLFAQRGGAVMRN